MDSTNTARDYLVDIIGLDPAETDALEAAGESLEFIAQAAAILFDQNGTTLSIEEVRAKIREQYPDAFNYKVVIPTNGAEIGIFTPNFLWNPYIPLNDITVLAAAGGSGKTFASNWIGAQVSRGGFIKGDRDFLSQEEARKTGIYPEPGNVLYISSEEEEELIKDRFKKSGGDPDRLYVIDRNKSIDMSFTDGYLPFMLSIQACHPRLVIVDPFQAYIGQSIDMNRQNHIRNAVQKLASIAKKCECAIIAITHTNKKDQPQNINNAVNGSSELVNAARSALMVVQDPEETDSRILVHTKANYSALADSLKFHITFNGGFVYDGISLINRDTLETAARARKTLAEVLAAREESSEVSERLIEAVCKYAVDGKSLIVTYDQFMDDYGDDIFGNSSRPSMQLKKIKPQLQARGITLEFNTLNGKAKRKIYKDKNRNGVEISKEDKQGQA